MSTTETGTIRSMARSGKAFSLEGDGDTWYSVFDPSQMNGATRGATVEFTYASKSSGGRVYNNIKGQDKVLNPGFGDAGDSNNSGAVSASAGNTFGQMTLSRDRCIARQNACNVMANVLAANLNLDPESLDEVGAAAAAKLVVAGAQVIEEYTTGDLDKAEAESKIEQLVTSGVTSEDNAAA
jgi:hypothetical protein